KREDDDHNNNQLDMLDQSGERASEEIPDQRHREDPARPADDVVKGVTAIGHPAHAGDDGYEGSNDGHEPGDDDRRPAVLLVELVRALEVLGSKEPRSRFVEDARPDLRADPVGDDGPGDRAGDE